MPLNRKGEPPVHGGGVFQLARELGISVREITDFSANINPLGIPVKARAALAAALEELQHYPEMYAESLVAALAARHQVAAETILAGNGSTELIYLLFRELRPRKTLVLAPAFTEYERAAALHGSRVFFCSTARENGFQPDPGRMAAKLAAVEPEVCIFGNPNNPTGTALEPAAWQPVFAAAAARGTVCVVDEAFIDFADRLPSLVSRAADSDHVVVLRSLTKIFSLAGLRCGYLVTGRRLAKRLRSRQEPWNVNSLAIAAAREAVRDREFCRRTRDCIAREREFLVAGLKTFPFLRLFPSRVNYLLVEVESADMAADMALFLRREYRLLIRRCGDFSGLNGAFIRLAVKERTANELLLAGLQAFAVYSGAGGRK